MTRALFLIDDLGLGGAQRLLVNLLPDLRAAGVDAAVCSLGRDATLAPALRAAGVEVTVLGAHRWNPLLVGPIADLITAGNHAVLVASLTKSLVLGQKAAARAGVPFVAYDHTGPNWDMPGSVGGPLEDRVARVAYMQSLRHARQIIVVSESGREWLRPRLPDHGDRIRVITNCLNSETMQAAYDERDRHRASLRAELGLPAEARILLYAAGSRTLKRWPVFVEIAAALLERHADLHAVGAGAGDGDLLASLRVRASALGHRERIHLLGPRQDVPCLMAASDLFLHPSENESDGIVVKEAMAMGLPIVASDIPAVRANLADGAYAELVAVADIAGHIAACERVLADPPDQAAARAYALDQFSSARCAADTAALIAAALAD